jgi:hypothetical protein
MKVKDLTIEIEKAVKDYTEEVERGIATVIEKDVQEAVTELKNTSPKRTGEYAKGWTAKKEVSEGKIKMIIYNKNKPQITHLLEHGHAKRAGGRVSGIPHIKPVEQKLNEQVVRDIEDVIKRGGA